MRIKADLAKYPKDKSRGTGNLVNALMHDRNIIEVDAIHILENVILELELKELRDMFDLLMEDQELANSRTLQFTKKYLEQSSRALEYMARLYKYRYK